MPVALNARLDLPLPNRVAVSDERAPTKVAHFFVDESGDLTLFDGRGRIIVGEEGVSHTFMLGVAELPDPFAVARDLDELRARLMEDPYFRGVPSMRPEGGKTASGFHAKNDLPEIRREVFAYLASQPATVIVGLRRKRRLAEEYSASFARTGQKQSQHAIYSDLVKRLFEERLHLADENHIVFARRGKSTRNVALSYAIGQAKARFEAKWKKGIDRPTTIGSSTPTEATCLQVIDYYLWALQRMVERREDRYFALLAPNYRLVLDRDDVRTAPYGAYYSSKNPLTLEKLMPVL